MVAQQFSVFVIRICYSFQMVRILLWNTHHEAVKNEEPGLRKKDKMK